MMIDWLTLHTLPISALLLCILTFRHLIARHLGTRFSYLLWLSVPIYLLSTLSGLQAVAPVQVDFSLFSLAQDTVITPTLKASAEQTSLTSLPKLIFELNLLMIIWSFGAIGMMIYLGAQLIFTLRLLADSYIPATHHELIQQSLNNHRFRYSDRIDSPVVIGFLRPFILLPVNFLHDHEPSSISLILQHEAHHARRHDNLINLLALLTLTIFWFNPLHWLAYHCFRTDQELSCDEHVLAKASAKQRKRYAVALLNFASANKETLFVNKWCIQPTLYRRLKMIAQHRHSRFRSVSGAILITSLMISILFIAPSTHAQHEVDTAIPQASSSAMNIIRVHPNYPAQAAADEVEGFVTMSYQLDNKGRPINIRVVDSKPVNVFEDASIEALRQWRFAPPSQEDRSVFQETLRFSIEDHEKHNRSLDKRLQEIQLSNLTRGFIFQDKLDENPAVIETLGTPFAPTENAEWKSQDRELIILEFTINKEGRVKNPTLQSGNPNGMLNQFMLHAIEQFRFSPPIINGEPVAIRAHTAYLYTGHSDIAETGGHSNSSSSL